MTGGAEDGVDRIAFGSGQVVAFEVAVFLQVADDRLDTASSSHFPADGGRGNPPGVGDGDVEAVTIYPVPAVAAVDIGAGNGRFGQAGHLLDLSGKAVAVIGITRQSHGPEDELAALAALVCGGDGGLAAELVAGAGLALSPSRRCDASTAGQWMHSTSGAWKA